MADRAHEVHNRRLLDPLLVSLLEGYSGKKLTKLRLILPNKVHPDCGWYRWILEGIENIHYSNCTGYETSTLFGAIRLPLQDILGANLLRVVQKLGCNSLTLDFQNYEDIFMRVDPEKIEKWKGVDLSSFRKAERDQIHIPLITSY